jgi:hypothetical protein
VQPIIPEAVSITDQATGMLGLKTEFMIPYLVKGMQEQQAMITGIDLKTNTNVTSVSDLQLSVDQQLAAISSNFATQGTIITGLATKNSEQDLAVAALQTSVADIATTNQAIQNQMDLIKQQNQTLIDFIAVLNIDSLIYKDVLGNLNLLDGKLTASGIETGVLTINVLDVTRPTIGQDTISKVTVDANVDGIDDVTGSDGKVIEIKTGAVSADSKVFTSFVKNPGSFNWVEKVKDQATGEFTGFKIFVEKPVSEDVGVDWWIVESKK